MTAREATRALSKLANKKKASVLLRFFKTGKGEYGEGDRFIGVVVPQLRSLSKQFREMPLEESTKLIRSKIHEERLLALFIWVKQYRVGDEWSRKKIFNAYLRHRLHINNWDLIDSSAEHIVGPYLKTRSKTLLRQLAKSPRLWDRRVAILSTFHYLREGDFDLTLAIAKQLLKDEHDLIHKAVGWLLREVGNRDLKVEEKFLRAHYKKMPRTMLRYAIEKFPETKRKAYLKGAI